MRRILAACLVAGMLALLGDTASAYNDHGMRWDHLVLTHDGPADLDAYVSDALSQWTAASALRDGGQGDDILITFGTPPGGSGNAAFADRDTAPQQTDDGTYVIERCTVIVDEAQWADLSRYQRTAIVLHEVGHCLGLGHPNGANPPQQVDAVMNSPATLIALQPDDIAGIQAIYGPPLVRRAIVPGLAQ